MKTKIEYKKFLDELVSEYCSNSQYCLFKEFLISSHPDPRMLLQLKCLEKYKYEKLQKDINWSETLLKWVENGYAKKFGTLFSENPDISFKEIYFKLFNN